MVMTLRKRARALETPANSKQINKNSNHEEEEPHSKISKTEEISLSGYEQSRDQRIKENMERMKKLGIMDLSLKIKSEFVPPKRSQRNNLSGRRTPQSSPLPSSLPRRRSSRLQNVTPVSYVEVREKKNRANGLDNLEELVGEGSKEELYTEEHEKLLGTYEAEWTLFVDGYGTDGKRIYDPVKGKTCHQCRQKTLGHRTHCIRCNLVQGQFCGDCLFMRYGENVLEVNKNPSWICPVCRGICNCSLCRQAKGWLATGSLYRKISRLGFKSVAHYLIQTRRSKLNSEGETSTDPPPVSAKKSLPFSDEEELSERKESLGFDESNIGSPKPNFEDKQDDDELNGCKEESSNMDCKHDLNNVATENDPKSGGFEAEA